LLPAPDAFAEDCTAGYAGEQSRRQKDVVDLVALGAVTEGAGSAVARETRMGGDVAKVGLGEQRIERRRVGRVVEVARTITLV
jgi:hypothetical protein